MSTNFELLRSLAALSMALAMTTASVPALAQAKPSPRPPAPAERISDTLLRVGSVRVDLAKKEISVTGTVTDAQTLEFVAVAKGGQKAYESALELDTDAINFNLGLLLIGLDQTRGVPSRYHFDPVLPQGDPVEIWVEWDDAGQSRKVRGEELVFNQQTKATLSTGPWVYTGSVFSAQTNAYLADIEGTLIGFVHTPAPIIESPRPLAPGVYGSNRLNPTLNLKPGQKIVLTARAIAR
jgi:hypothetical protein